MTGVTITFVSNHEINIANATGSSVTFAIAKLLTSGVFDTADSLTIADSSNSNYDFGEDIGVYRIWNPNSSTGNTIIISSSITDELEVDVKEILLSDDLNKNLPKGYDFVNLALLSILFIGNSPYQNADYNASYLTLYTVIAEAISRCEYYLDRQTNTPQSTNKIWQ
jgi:hypothetical protein